MIAVPKTEVSQRDDELIGSISNGNLHSLGVLFDRYAPDVRRFVGRLGVSPHQVDDLVQSTFLEVTHAASRFDGRLSAKTWLFGIAAIMVRRHRRSLARLAERLDEWARELRSIGAPESPAENYDRSLEAQRAVAALDKLSPKKREVFLMVAVENATGEEAARALGIPIATVWTRLHHARRELKAHLTKEEA